MDAGVDAIWMSPIFESPMIDFGYDISNFYEIHYEYGTMEDFEELLEKAHSLGKFVNFATTPVKMRCYFYRNEVLRLNDSETKLSD